MRWTPVVMSPAIAAATFALTCPAANAASLSKKSAATVVATMERLAVAHGGRTLTDPAAAIGDAAAEATLQAAGYTPERWREDYAELLTAYRAIKADSKPGEQKPKAKSGLLGRVLSAQNISHLGGAALFGGSRGAGQAGLSMGADALAESSEAGAALAGLGTAATYGGGRGLKQATAQTAIDGAAQLIAHDASREDRRPKDVKPALSRKSLAAVKPYVARIDAVLNP